MQKNWKAKSFGFDQYTKDPEGGGGGIIPISQPIFGPNLSPISIFVWDSHSPVTKPNFQSKQKIIKSQFLFYPFRPLYNSCDHINSLNYSFRSSIVLVVYKFWFCIRNAPLVYRLSVRYVSYFFSVEINAKVRVAGKSFSFILHPC